MSLRLEMLQVARLAPKLLGEASPLVVDFFRRQQNPDGGFKDRSGRSDLYYTVFGLDGLIALQAPVPTESARAFLSGFGHGADLDFVHLCCLARAWAALTACESSFSRSASPPAVASEVLRRIGLHRTPDGGYNPVAGSLYGTAYGCFLALGAHQDLQASLPHASELALCLKELEVADGVWANDRAALTGSTNATVAAVQVLRHLGQAIPPKVADWLRARCHPQGGFLATPNAPMPDLLSTATSLHALAVLGVPLERLKDRCLDFIDSLWTNQGAFHGHWADDHVDCEYTFYGLLALGHLSL